MATLGHALCVSDLTESAEKMGKVGVGWTQGDPFFLPSPFLAFFPSFLHSYLLIILEEIPCL